MKFVPRLPDSDVNVARGPHLWWFLKLALTLIAAVLLAYAALGLIADQIASRISVETENKLLSFYVRERPQPDDDAERLVQAVVDRVAAQLDEQPGYQWRGSVQCTSIVNAYALPGGVIELHKGLLKHIESENELAMLVGHEIGHFVHRDHLRKLGRQLVPLVIKAVLGLGGGGIDDVVDPTLVLGGLQYSRQQERAADLLGLELLQRSYGHVGGAVQLYQHLDQASSSEWLHGIPDLLSTHPNEERRIDSIRREIQRRNWQEGEKKGLPQSYWDSLCRPAWKLPADEADLPQHREGTGELVDSDPDVAR